MLSSTKSGLFAPSLGVIEETFKEVLRVGRLVGDVEDLRSLAVGVVGLGVVFGDVVSLLVVTIGRGVVSDTGGLMVVVTSGYFFKTISY